MPMRKLIAPSAVDVPPGAAAESSSAQPNADQGNPSTAAVRAPVEIRPSIATH